MKEKLSSVCDFSFIIFLFCVGFLVYNIVRCLYLLSKFNVMVALLSPNSFFAVTLYLPASSTVTFLISRAAKYSWPSLSTDNCRNFKRIWMLIWFVGGKFSENNLVSIVVGNVAGVVRPSNLGGWISLN